MILLVVGRGGGDVVGSFSLGNQVVMILSMVKLAYASVLQSWIDW